MPPLTPDSPQSLAEQTQRLLQEQDFEGAYDAFGKLQDLLYPHLMGRAKRKMRLAEAEDMVQEALMGLYRQLKSKECPKNVQAWTVNVVDKRIADYYRVQRNTKELLAAPRFWEAHANRQKSQTGIGANPLMTAMKNEEQRQLNALLDSLSGDVRSVIEAHIYDELSWAEIAEQHGLSVDAVKQKSQRALSTMIKMAVKRGFKHEN